MPLDGIVLSNIKWEIESLALNARIDKIYQPENDEIIMSVRSYGETRKLLLSANPSSPKVCFTGLTRENPKNAPLFCMVLRKHLSGGKLTGIVQPGFERILILSIESMNEMGDISEKRLIIEIMGKHSNVILVDSDNTIIDSIKRVSLDKSSVRQVLPGRAYEFPPAQNKLNPTEAGKESFIKEISAKSQMKVQEAIYKSYSGISPIVGSEIAMRGGIDPSDYVSEIGGESLEALYASFEEIFLCVKTHEYTPYIYYDENSKAIDYSSIVLSMLSGMTSHGYESISQLIDDFYKQKDAYYRSAQKAHDLKKLVSNHVERLSKKNEILLNTLDEIKDRGELRLRGELITANIHNIKQGQTTVKLTNYYDENAADIEIALDPTLTPAENAQSYFKKYNKQKRTEEAALSQLAATNDELYYLGSVLSSLEASLSAGDIEDVRNELKEQGFIKKGTTKQKKAEVAKSKPLRFKSSDGFDIYVGKNNRQNDELTGGALPSDIWLHTKNIPGSHVIIKTAGASVPDRTLEEAAYLAAHYSKDKDSGTTAVDYTIVKNVKKPSGAKPGMVIYNNYNTIFVAADINVIKQINFYGETL